MKSPINKSQLPGNHQYSMANVPTWSFKIWGFCHCLVIAVCGLVILTRSRPYEA